MWASDEPEGWQLIAFVGQISTLEVEDEFEPPWDEEKLPFGFQAPAPAAQPLDLPVLDSAAWAAWLDC